jgi:orotidine-5'-phosphate decarboxylase
MAEVIVALDVADAQAARGLVERLGPELRFVKVGLELFTREGPAVVQDLKALGLRVFLDLKLHDIPATVAGAVRSASALGVDLLTVHASGGRRMLEAAAASAAEAAPGRLRVVGVTVLTSLSGAELSEAWGRDPGVDPETEVLRLATLVRETGLHGVVSSPEEARSLRLHLGEEAAIITPGIRFAGGDAHDQTRIATPASAVSAGADHLVVGRAVTGAADPAAALRRVLEDVRGTPAGVSG